MPGRRAETAGAAAALAEAVAAFLCESPGGGLPADAGRRVPPLRDEGLQRAVTRAVVTVGGDSALALTLDSFARVCDLVIDIIEVEADRGNRRH